MFIDTSYNRLHLLSSLTFFLVTRCWVLIVCFRPIYSGRQMYTVGICLAHRLRPVPTSQETGKLENAKPSRSITFVRDCGRGDKWRVAGAPGHGSLRGTVNKFGTRGTFFVVPIIKTFKPIKDLQS